MVFLLVESLPLVDRLMQGLHRLSLLLQPLLQALLVLRQVAGKDVKTSRSFLENLKPLLQGCELIGKVLITVIGVLTRILLRLWHVELGFPLSFLQVVLELPILLLQPCVLLGDGAKVLHGPTELSLHLRLVSDGFVTLNHCAADLVHKVGHLGDAILHLVVVAPRGQTALQQPNLHDVCFTHLGHHVDGFLRLFRALPSFSLRIQQLSLQCIRLFPSFLELLFKFLRLGFEGLLLGRRDGELLLQGPEFPRQLRVLLQRLLESVSLDALCSALVRELSREVDSTHRARQLQAGVHVRSEWRRVRVST
mmetsp:Transcript_36945/g.81095  ORF Transcript_36945/g.81095 Transcript_36945/m.81095 type:complete len:308 (+) Transcript_36945:1256-2179(+)